MKISLEWIKDFVELPEMDIHDMANDFILSTAEVEEVIEKDAHLLNVSVAEIISMRKHPEADRLNLVTFKYGNNQEREVVCGAPNVRKGLKVPFADSGTILPGGFKLEPKKIRGFLSSGMLCSQKELGLGDGEQGLMELDENAKVGLSLAEYLNRKADYIFDVDNKSLTHRPDLWGMYGLAREFASIYQKELKDTFSDTWKKKLESSFGNEKAPKNVKVEKDSSCLAFWGLSVDNVSITDSPRWMQERLEAVGLRPINNIVDISNYVMMELGLPLHIYDRDLIKGDTIQVKKINENMEFVTLDEIKRSLIPGDTLIGDSEKPLVLAGIMGGASSGVNDQTKNIFIEVANWKAEEVRRTSSRIGLRTDSSSRYEKSLDSQLTYRTLLRTLELVQELCPNAKVIGKPVYDGDSLENFNPFEITLKLSHVRSILGAEIEFDKVTNILSNLDFKVSGLTNDEFSVKVPSYRSTKDIECDADIIEELGRIIGYDNLPVKAPSVELGPLSLSAGKQLERKTQDFWSIKARSLEIMTYPMIGQKLLQKAIWPDLNEDLKVVNSLSKEHDRMRPSLIPSLLESCALNIKNFDQFSFFELGRSYHLDKKDWAREDRVFAFVSFNKNKTPFTSLINQFEDYLHYLKLPFSIEDKNPKFKNDLVPSNWVGVHPFEYLDIKVMGKNKGCLFSIHPMVLKEFKIKGHVSVGLFNYSDLYQRELKPKFSYKALPKFPAANFDCTVLVKKSDQLASVLTPLKKLKQKEITSYKVVDVFDLNENEHAVTLRFLFQDSEKTLGPEVIKGLEDTVVSTLNNSGFPLKN